MASLGWFTADRRRMVIAVVLVLLLAAGLRLVNIGWSYSNNGIDEGVMLQRARLVSDGYVLYRDLPCDQAPLAFYMGAVFGGDVVSLRAMTALLSLAAVAACMLAARRLAGDRAMLVAGLLLAVDFAFVRESRLFSLDAISASFLALALLPFIVYQQRGDRAALVLSGLMIGLATATKLIGGLALAGVLLYFVIGWARDRRVGRAQAVDLVLVSAAAVVPVGVFMAYLGPSEVLQGMVLNQGHRSFDLWLKVSIVAFFGLNLAYLLPVMRARVLMTGEAGTRFLMAVFIVLLLFMVAQPLVFLHHMVFMGPPLAILAGVLVGRWLDGEKHLDESDTSHKVSRKGISQKPSDGAWIGVLTAVGLLLSAGLGAAGVTMQGEPVQVKVAAMIEPYVVPGGWMVSGDPIIASYAGARVPPELANVAYRQYPDLTLEKVEANILAYDVSVVVVCYRLNEFTGLPQFLLDHGYVQVLGAGSQSEDGAVLDLFQEGLGTITAYARADLV